MLENGRCGFNVEFVFVNNFLKIFDAFIELMIMGGQMGVNNTYRYTVQFESYTHSTFIAL